MPGGVGRLEPLGDEDTRRRLDAGERGGDPVEPAPHPGRELLGLSLGSQPHPDRANRLPDVLQRRGREVEHLDVERTRLQDPFDLVGGDGADVAELLHDDHVGLDLRPPLLLDRVERPAVPRRLGDHPVDLAARQVAGLDQRRGDDGLRRRLRRPVALVGDADHAVPQAQPEEDLGRGGDERADSHEIQTTRACAG